MTGDQVPKALLEVAGVPIIFRQLQLLARESIEQVVVLAGYLGSALRAALVPEAARLGLRLTVTIETEPRGTAGSLSSIASLIDQDAFLVVYGDTVFDLCLSRLFAFHRRHGGVATIVAHPNDHPETSDLLATDPDGRVTAVLPRRERPPGDYRNLVPAGLYVCAPDILRALTPGQRADFIHDLFPALVRSGQPVYAYQTPEYLRDVGTPERCATAAADIARGAVAALRADHERPALFFDCDGVLNAEPGGHGVLTPNDVTLLPGAAAAVRRAHDAQLLTIGVTNKPQVAKGLVEPAALPALLGRLETLLARKGAVLDRLYYCPHHPERGFPGEVADLKMPCDCRKPAPGMLRQAMDDLPVAVARSTIVGDSWRDIAAGHAAGVYAYGVRTGHGCRALPAGVRPDAMFADVGEAVDFTLGYRRLAEPVLACLASIAAPRPIIAVCGPSRSGKSLLAHALTRALADAGRRPLHVRLDDWIVPLPERHAGMTADTRHRLDGYRAVVAGLARGDTVTAPGYDPATRAGAPGVPYDATDADVVVLDGIFAGHATARDLLDLVVYREIEEAALIARLSAFYQWKGLAPTDIAALIAARRGDEWPAVATQRAQADVVLAWTEGSP
ncbi:MAG: HAD-IIIA family hydrolase [Chloroflexi bacterium]|nr:HAD-IIIA family hydrolase [Chloroflexota bacterium]